MQYVLKFTAPISKCFLRPCSKLAGHNEASAASSKTCPIATHTTDQPAQWVKLTQICIDEGSERDGVADFLSKGPTEGGNFIHFFLRHWGECKRPVGKIVPVSVN